MRSPLNKPQEELRHVVERIHGAPAQLIRIVPVHETFSGAVVWDGYVHEFLLTGHPQASRYFAWSHETEPGKAKTYAVLAVPPVTSAADAVRAAIVSDYRKAGN